MNKKRSMSKRELIREISDVTQLKTSVVKSVLDAFADIFIRESVINGIFNFSNCFSVKTHRREKRTQYNVNRGEFLDYPETEILGITLSKKIHYFHRWKQRHQYNEKHGLTIEDWQNRQDQDIPQ